MSFEPTYWHWLVLACLFLVIEIAAPMTFFLWLALAAVASAAVAFLAPDLGWQTQYVLFAAFCILSLFAWRRFSKEGDVSETDQPNLNRRTQRYLGRTLTLSEPIVNGIGKVKVDDSQWKVAGADAAKGAQVKVVSIEGSVLQVEPA